MNRVPSGSLSSPPSPRTASEIRNDLACGWYRQVGWNWMNSMFAMRRRRASPSRCRRRVAVSGLVVYR